MKPASDTIGARRLTASGSASTSATVAVFQERSPLARSCATPTTASPTAKTKSPTTGNDGRTGPTRTRCICRNYSSTAACASLSGLTRIARRIALESELDRSLPAMPPATPRRSVTNAHRYPAKEESCAPALSSSC